MAKVAKKKFRVFIFGNGPFMETILLQIRKHRRLELQGIISPFPPAPKSPWKTHYKGADPSVLSRFGPDIVLLLEYPSIVPAALTRKYPFINSHGALLPDYRGFHGSGWAFVNGEPELGYTIHLADEDFDAGRILYQKTFPMTEKLTFHELKTRQMAHLEANYLKVVLHYLEGKLKPFPQTVKYPKYVGKRTLRDCYIDWNQDAEFLERFIRALSPPSAPGAFTVYNDEKIVLLTSWIYPCADYVEIPGHVVNIKGSRILVKTRDKCLWVEDVIYKNKKMKAASAIWKIGARLGLDPVQLLLKEKGLLKP